MGELDTSVGFDMHGLLRARDHPWPWMNFKLLREASRYGEEGSELTHHGVEVIHMQ